MNNNKIYRDIDALGVSSMIKSIKLDDKYKEYFNKNILKRYSLVSKTKLKSHRNPEFNLLKTDLIDGNTTFFFSFETLFLLKTLLVGAKMTKSIDSYGNTKTNTLQDSLKFEKKLYDQINESTFDYGMCRLKHTEAFIKSELSINTVLPILNKLNGIFTLLSNNSDEINKIKVLHFLSDELDTSILNLLLLNTVNIEKQSKYKLLHDLEKLESLDIASNLSLDEQIVKHILVENTLGFLLYNDKNAGLVNSYSTLKHRELYNQLTNIYSKVLNFKNQSSGDGKNSKFTDFIKDLTKYRNSLQILRTTFFNNLKQYNTDVPKLIEQTFFDDSINNVYIFDMCFNSKSTVNKLPCFNEFIKKNESFFNTNPKTPYTNEVIKELLTLIDCYFVECFISEDHKEYKQAYRTTIQPKVENNKKMSNIINFLSSSKSSMNEEKSIELLNLTLDLLNEEKIKQEQKLNDIADKIKEINKYKDRPMDFYDDYSFKEYKQPSDNTDKKITSLQESLINIINSIYEDDQPHN